MERLTARNSIGQVYFPHCFREDTCDGDGASDKCNTCDFNQKIADTLAKFEDLQDMIGIPFKEHAALCREHIPDDAKYPSKAIVLTDESVDEWNQYKTDKEQGLLLRLPCKVGDTVYIIGGTYRCGREEYWINTGKFRFSDLDNLNKSVFLTKEEAEQALVEMEGE